MCFAAVKSSCLPVRSAQLVPFDVMCFSAVNISDLRHCADVAGLTWFCKRLTGATVLLAFPNDLMDDLADAIVHQSCNLGALLQCTSGPQATGTASMPRDLACQGCYCLPLS